MADRPSRLPACACLVVWGAEQVTLAEATVWYHDWLLDFKGGPDASYISAKSMAARLRGKVSTHTVEQSRVRLGRLGLYYAFRRPEGREFGRVCILPAQCIPRTNAEAQIMAPLLDAHIRSIENGSMVKEPRVPLTTNSDFQQVEPHSGSSVRVEGGRGEGGTLSSGSLPERQLFPVVVVENREVAHAPERGKRLPGESATAWIERLAAHG